MIKRVTKLSAAIFCCLLIASSCNKINEPDPLPNGEVEISLENDVQPILNQNCIMCHPSNGGMSLIQGETYSNLVNIVSPNYQKVRVSPFYADSSVICYKLHGIEGYGFQMPLNGIPLEDEEIYIIEEWIRQGALDN